MKNTQRFQIKEAVYINNLAQRNGTQNYSFSRAICNADNF